MKTNGHHPNIINYLDSFYRDDGVLLPSSSPSPPSNVAVNPVVWVVTEHMGGTNIREWMESGENSRPFEEKHVAFVCLSILKGLSHLHGLHRVYRNVNTGSVLICEDGTIKLAQFEFAAQLTQEQPTLTGIVGDKLSMSPEMVKGSQYGQKIDVWSLGVTLFEMCEGNQPYSELPILRALFMISTKGLPAFEGQREWSPELYNFLSRCTERDRVARADVEELLAHPFLKNACDQNEMASLTQKVKNDNNDNNDTNAN